MTLICILAGLGLEYYLGNLDQYRKFDWFERYCAWLELNFGNNPLYKGSTGVLLTLIPPLLLLLLAAYLLAKISLIIYYLFVIMVFLYNLGPSLNLVLNDYLAAIDEDNESRIAEIENKLIESDSRDEETLYQSILVRAHDSLFGMIFWFCILGIVGVMLFNLVILMKDRYGDIHGDYPESIATLYKILIWPSTRLLALGFALGGSLVDALEGWGRVEGFSLDSSRLVLVNSGLGAVQYQPEQYRETVDHIEIIKHLQALINRSLIVWLTVLGLMTITGWLS